MLHLALDPFPPLNSLLICVEAKAILLSVFPRSIILSTVLPREHPMALLSVVDKIAFVSASIIPPEDSFPMHFVSVPLTLVVATVGPCVLSMALDVIVLELSDVASSVLPVELAVSMLGTVDVRPFIACFIRPRLHTMTVLLVFLPIALVNGPIVMHVLSMSVGLVVQPLALINVAVRMDQPSDAIGFAVLPLPLVERPIEPDLASLTRPRRKISLPLADIDSAARQPVRTLRFQIVPRRFKVRDLKRTMLFIDFPDRFVLEKVALIDSVVELTLLVSILQHVSDLFKPLAYHICAE